MLLGRPEPIEALHHWLLATTTKKCTNLAVPLVQSLKQAGA
jgi:hypothetical protein